jgi:endonuclease/exonuclease/phosphatase family metal-dependent hydrolase
MSQVFANASRYDPYDYRVQNTGELVKRRSTVVLVSVVVLACATALALWRRHGEEPARGDSVRVVTLNVAQNLLLADTNAARLGHLMNAIQRVSADVYLLQECYLACQGVVRLVPGYDANTASSVRPDIKTSGTGLSGLIERLGARARRLLDGFAWHGNGQVILVKKALAVEAAEFEPFAVNSLSDYSIQGLQEVRVRLPGGQRVLVANAHFDPALAGNRRSQAAQVAAHLAARRRPGETVILGGDFNEDAFEVSGSFGRLLRGDDGITFVPAYGAGQPPTWDTARNPLATDAWPWTHIDNILVSNESRATLESASLVFAENDYPYAADGSMGPLSDHYGVEARFRFP